MVYAPVDDQGVLRPETLKSLINKDTVLVSVMLANNETGVIQPITSLVKIAHQYNAIFPYKHICMIYINQLDCMREVHTVTPFRDL